jgi:hypothetical protein
MKLRGTLSKRHAISLMVIGTVVCTILVSNEVFSSLSPRNESERKGKSQSEMNTSNSTGLCEGKDAILMVQGGDSDAAVGTMFFMYVVNHFIYADMYNLLPWVHLDPKFPCYDEVIHGNYTKTFTMLSGVHESQVVGQGDMLCNYWKKPQYYPGKPDFQTQLNPTEFTIVGNGLWASYFHSVGGYPPDDPSCKDKPLILLNKRSRFPGMHVCAPWGVRPWSLNKVPEALRPTNKTVHEWAAPMRERGAEKVAKYYQPLPWILDLVQKANPNPDKKCLSMHIRLTDKGHGRQKKPLTIFQAYAEEYSKKSGGGALFVATDDGTIMDVIRSQWKISKMYSQNNILRSSGQAAIFRTFVNETHRTNAEGIVDMYAMSRCDFFVHGFSAMAEAAIFINPQLHNRSVNVDVSGDELMSLETFGNKVQAFYKNH